MAKTTGDQSMTEADMHAAPEAIIEDDLRCMQCGYRLRGLQDSGLCPECGASIAASRSFPHAAIAIRRALWLWLASWLVMLAVGILAHGLFDILPAFHWQILAASLIVSLGTALRLAAAGMLFLKRQAWAGVLPPNLLVALNLAAVLEAICVITVVIAALLPITDLERGVKLLMFCWFAMLVCHTMAFAYINSTLAVLLHDEFVARARTAAVVLLLIGFTALFAEQSLSLMPWFGGATICTGVALTMLIAWHVLGRMKRGQAF